MPKLEDYKILAPFSADELVANTNALLRHLPEAQVQKRTLRFYSSQGLLPPPEGPRSKAQYRYEHLVILVALRVFKQLGLKLERIEDIIRSQRAEGIDKLAQTVQWYLDQAQRGLPDLAAISYLVSPQEQYDVVKLMGSSFAKHPLQSLRGDAKPTRQSQKRMRVELTPDVTLEVSEDKPLQSVLQEAYQKLKKLLGLSR